MAAIDVKKDLAALYRPPADRAVEVDVPPLRYLMVDGRGAPAGPEYPDAIATLYPVAYTLKFALRGTIDFTVAPLETLWWSDGPGAFHHASPEDWRWTAMIAVPVAITEGHLATAAAELHRKKKAAPLLDRVRVAALDEGRAVQTMHVGPYDREMPAIRRVHDYMTDNGLMARGHHHEIYLSDPRTTAPERLKTVIRQPVH